ncbi:hypothetical protein [Mesorhizobium salmacidum]|uniref:Uncharacterized protein n=1 Tax=Mesorhizobium salmacidum TaxID=3015171 RepID=A0ABU8L5J0_9HYPH
MNKQEIIDGIRCRQANGQECIVLHFQVMVGLNSSPPQYAKGRDRYELENGVGVELMKDGTSFKVHTGEMLSKI